MPEQRSEEESIPEWHWEIIERRLQRMRDNPHPGFTVSEIFERLRTRQEKE